MTEWSDVPTPEEFERAKRGRYRVLEPLVRFARRLRVAPAVGEAARMEGAATGELPEAPHPPSPSQVRSPRRPRSIVFREGTRLREDPDGDDRLPPR